MLMSPTDKSRLHDHCRVMQIKDANGIIRELVFPKALDLDRPKRARTSFTPEQLYRLEKKFQQSQYIVGKERTELSRILQLSETQVKVWFQNRRTKHKRDKSTEADSSNSFLIPLKVSCNDSTSDKEIASLSSKSKRNNNNPKKNAKIFTPYSLDDTARSPPKLSPVKTSPIGFSMAHAPKITIAHPPQDICRRGEPTCPSGSCGCHLRRSDLDGSIPHSVPNPFMFGNWCPPTSLSHLLSPYPPFHAAANLLY